MFLHQLFHQNLSSSVLSFIWQSFSLSFSAKTFLYLSPLCIHRLLNIGLSFLFNIIYDVVFIFYPKSYPCFFYCYSIIPLVFIFSDSYTSYFSDVFIFIFYFTSKSTLHPALRYVHKQKRVLVL